MLDISSPSIPFISLINRKHVVYINNKLKKYSLTSGQYPLLIEIYKNDGIIQEELANLLHVNESTITRTLEKLEDNDYIFKRHDENRRKNHIYITDVGRKVVKKVMNYEEDWDDYCCSNLTEEEYLTFKKLLIKVSNKILEKN